jgi:hypothetical protein
VLIVNVFVIRKYAAVLQNAGIWGAVYPGFHPGPGLWTKNEIFAVSMIDFSVIFVLLGSHSG